MKKISPYIFYGIAAYLISLGIVLVLYFIEKSYLFTSRATLIPYLLGFLAGIFAAYQFKKDYKGYLSLNNAIMQIFGAYLITITLLAVSIDLLFLAFDPSLLTLFTNMRLEGLQADLKAGVVTQAQIDQFKKSIELTGPARMLLFSSSIILLVTAALGLFSSMIAAYFVHTKPKKAV